MTSKRAAVWSAVLEEFAEGTTRFETKKIREKVDVSYETVLNALEDMENEGWLRRIEPDDRSFAWEPTGKTMDAFRRYNR